VLKIVNATVKAGKTELVVAVHPDLITAENIMVHDSAEEGETANFIETERKSVSSLDDLATKYGAMKALGMVAYELLMKGVGPPVSSFLPSALSDMGGTAHLPLSIRDIGECVESRADQMNQAARKVPRKEAAKHQGRITAAMINTGVPYPLCRFVVDLLGGELSDGLLLRSDNSFESFSDVLSDLKQMMMNPDAFIHLSVKDQWRLAFGNKMHGRESEKKMIMDAASQTSGTTSNDALFEALSLLLPQNKQQIGMCHGKPGSGKSRLIMETKKDLEKKGWLFLSCKFDRIVHAEPLSVMASAFEEFLEQCLGSSRQQQISTNLKTLMLPGDILILTKHIPCLIKYLDDPHNPLADVEVSKEQMHRLFHQLLAVLSVTGQPIAFFADDLQWADGASIDFFVALTKASEPELTSSHRDTNTALKIMLIGSYRDNEVDDDHPLAQVLHKLKSRNSSIEVADIAVCGFNLETLNQILSESLCLPLRRTKLLSDIVLQKTDGIAIHIIEFIGRLTMDRILCHSFVKGWEWDTEVIESYPISNSVAELFVFKLNKLPSNALRALQICSIFGSQIEHRIINFVQDFDGDQTVDITAGLKVAGEMGLVEMIGTANVFKFAHDIIAEVRFSFSTTIFCSRGFM
jgi:ATP-dependent RNA helicase DDX31/DBP7